MRNQLTRVVPILLMLMFGGGAMACNLSSVSLTSVVYNSGPGTYTINFRLNVGQGRTGNVTGADNDTRTVSIALYRGCGPLSVVSFSPALLAGAFTSCSMPGSSLGPQGGPFGCQAMLAYIDPGYYGQMPCQTQPFACISSTNLCGNVQSAPYNISITVSAMPDSLRVFGVEGNSNPIAGCYPNTDMKIDFSTPTILCPGPQNVAANPNCQGTLPNFIASVSTIFGCNNPGLPTITQSPTAGTTMGSLGSSTTVTMTATYPNSSMVQCSFAATVADLTPPILTCPSNSTVSLGPNCQWVVPSFTVSAVDNCTPNPTITQSPTAGSVIVGGGVTTVIVVATDAAGNASTCNFQVSRVENTPPTINCPGNQSLNLNSNCQATLPNYGSMTTAADNCTANPVLSQSPSAGTVLSGIGAGTATMTATDGAGNTATCSFTVTRVDASLPTITCPGPQTVSLNPNCVGTLPSYSTQTTASDNCTSSPALGQSPGSGATIGAGPTTVTMTATDASSNSSTCSFTVTGVDATAPNITCPGGQTLSLNPNCVINVPNLSAQATATDNCSSNIGITQSPTAGTAIIGVGSNTVILTATDGAGNSSTCSVVLTSVDQTPPNISCPPNSSLTLGNNCQGTYPSFTAQATDNCTANLTVTQSPAGGSPITSPGTYTVTFTASDASGNSTTCSLSLTAGIPSIAGSTSVSNINPCQGDTIALTSNASGTAYNWSTGSTTNTTIATTSGWYWVDVTIGSGCVARDSILLTFQSAPVTPVITQNGNTLCTGSYSAYQWLLNGTPIVGATGQCVTMNNSGNYTVVVTGSNGCSAQSVGFAAVGVSQQIEGEFTVYPVPSTTEVKLRLPIPLEDAGGLRLYDLTGRLVRSWSFSRLDLETSLSIDGLSEGTYIMELRTAEWAAVRKVVKLN